jgi:hypothetical protein
MSMVDAYALLATIFVPVDDWLWQFNKLLIPAISAVLLLKSAFNENNLFTLLLPIDYFPYPEEKQIRELFETEILQL